MVNTAVMMLFIEVKDSLLLERFKDRKKIISDSRFEFPISIRYVRLTLRSLQQTK